MLREKIAKLEHEQWIEWSKTLADSEDISLGRLIRWTGCWKDYKLLSEQQKDFDRIWADKILALPELKEVIEKARKWDEAMQQTHYCSDCKAALLDQRILELECELVKYKGKEEVILNGKTNRRYGMNQDYNVS